VKKVGKPVFFLVAAVIVAMGFLAVLGISETYGDITTDKIKGVDDISWGTAVSGGAELKFVPADGVSATDDQIKEVRSLMAVRLDNLGINDSSLKTDGSAITVKLPFEKGGDFDIDDIAQELSERAALTFREGYEYDEATGKPAGVTLENIIFSGAEVQNAEAVYTTENNMNVCYVKLTLNDEAKAAFEQATTKLLGNRISIWMDDTLLAVQSVSRIVNDGVAYISGDMTAYQAMNMATKVNVGALPIGMKLESSAEFAPAVAGGKTVFAAGFAVLILAAAVYMSAKFKFVGLVGVIALLGQAVVLIMALTGFVPAIAAVPVNVSSVLGAAAAVVLGVYTLIEAQKSITEKAKTAKVAKAAVYEGVRSAAKSTAKLNGIVFVVCLVLMVMFASAGSVFSKALFGILSFIGKGANDVIYPFAHMLLWGVVGSVVMNLGAYLLMLSSLAGFKKFSALELYGKK